MADYNKSIFLNFPTILCTMAIFLFLAIYLTVFCFAREMPVASITNRESDIKTFLVCGCDKVSGLNDVIFLAFLDTQIPSLNIIQIPRDTYYRCSPRSSHKINGASRALGDVRSFAGVLGDSMGITIDYTISFTLESFGKIVDHIGGVPINIPCDLYYNDESQGLHIDLKSGEQILNGCKAIQFVRFRSGYIQGDIARVDAQKLFMAAFAAKVSEYIEPTKIPSLIKTVIENIKTDISFTECVKLAKLAISLDMSNIKFVTLPGTDVRTGVNSGIWYYIINRKASEDIINRYFNNTDFYFEFDPDRLFTDSNYPHFNEIYDADGYSANEYSADDINLNGIDIAFN